MSITETEPRGGVLYTEGPEFPSTAELTYAYTPPSLPIRSTVTHYVQFRPYRLEEDGNNYLACTIQVTNKTYGQI